MSLETDNKGLLLDSDDGYQSYVPSQGASNRRIPRATMAALRTRLRAGLLGEDQDLGREGLLTEGLLREGATWRTGMEEGLGDFDALQDEYLVAHVRMRVLAIDARGRPRPDQLEWEQTLSEGHCVYHYIVRGVNALQAIEGHALYSAEFDGFIAVADQGCEATTITRLHNDLAARAKLFILERGGGGEGKLARKLLKYFRREWACPFLETKRWSQRIRQKALSKLTREVEKFEKRVLGTPNEGCCSRCIGAIADRDELGGLVLASVLRVVVVLHMVGSTLNLFLALECGHQLGPRKLDGSPLVIFTSLFAFFGFLVSGIAYYGLQRMSKQYVKLFQSGALITLIWSLVALMDALIPFLGEFPVREHAFFILPPNILVLIIALLLSRHELQRYHALRQARDRFRLERLLLRKNFKALSRSAMSRSSLSDNHSPRSQQSGSDGEDQYLHTDGGSPRKTMEQQSAELFPDTFGPPRQSGSPRYSI